MSTAPHTKSELKRMSKNNLIRLVMEHEQRILDLHYTQPDKPMLSVNQTLRIQSEAQELASQLTWNMAMQFLDNYVSPLYTALNELHAIDADIRRLAADYPLGIPRDMLIEIKEHHGAIVMNTQDMVDRINALYQDEEAFKVDFEPAVTMREALRIATSTGDESELRVILKSDPIYINSRDMALKHKRIDPHSLMLARRVNEHMANGMKVTPARKTVAKELPGVSFDAVEKAHKRYKDVV